MRKKFISKVLFMAICSAFFLISKGIYAQSVNQVSYKWSGGINPSINFFLSAPALIDSFILEYTIENDGCKIKSTTNFNNVPVTNKEIIIDWGNKYFTGTTWITDSVKLTGMFNNEMNLITGIYVLKSGVCVARISGEWSAKPESQNSIINNNNEFVFQIYPNPAKNIISIESSLQNWGLSVYSTDGKVLIKKLLNEGVNQIDISDLTPGIYIIRLKDSENVILRKFYKQ